MLSTIDSVSTWFRYRVWDLLGLSTLFMRVYAPRRERRVNPLTRKGYHMAPGRMLTPSLIRKMRAPERPDFCYWEEMYTIHERPVITSRNPKKKGDYILICDCDRCRPEPFEEGV